MISALDSITDNFERTIRDLKLIEIHGQVRDVTGAMIRATAPGARVGELCYLQTDGEQIMAEVVGFEGKYALLTPMGNTTGVSYATAVIPTGRIHEVPVGRELLGQVLDGLGQPSDSSSLSRSTTRPVYAAPPIPCNGKS